MRGDLIKYSAPLLVFLLAYPTDGFGSPSGRIFSPIRRSTATTSPRIQHIPVTAPVSSHSKLHSSKAMQESQRGSRTNPVRFLRTKLSQLRSSTRTKRNLLISAAGLFVTLIGRPTMALAMGGMGGAPRGPVAPMQRYVRLARRIGRSL